MKAVIEERDYTQKYPVYSDEPKNVKQISAVKLWNKIVYRTLWKSAEPGILFWDADHSGERARLLRRLGSQNGFHEPSLARYRCARTTRVVCWQSTCTLTW